MYKNIMVPLDGSELAECVLPHVESIVTGCAVSSVTFVRVVEPTYLPVGVGSDGGPIFTEKDAQRLRQQEDARNEGEARKYLDQLVQRIKLSGANNKTEVVEGKAADRLVDYAERNGVDLIVLASHGRSGVTRWVWGSVADKILHAVSVPLLMIRPPGCGPGAKA